MCDNRYTTAVGLSLPACPFEDPPLDAVVGAASHVSPYVCRLLERRAEGWPMPEFAVATSCCDQSSVVDIDVDVDGENCTEFAFVPGAARPSGGEILRSIFDDFGGDRPAARRLSVEASGGLPLDWTLWRPIKAQLPHSASLSSVLSVVEAACLPPVPQEIMGAFNPEALAGRGSARSLGAKGSLERVKQLEEYLGKDVLPKDLRCRLAEALERGTAMRGSPPPWRTLVRDALLRRVDSARDFPVVVHFVVATGQDRLVQSPA